MSALSTYCPPGSRIEISGPHGAGRMFRVDLVRVDNGRRVSQAVWVDYGDAILSAGEMERADVPVVDVVADPAAPRFDPRGC